MAKRVFRLELDGKEIVVEAGEYAKQANGSVLVRYNETAVITAGNFNNAAV